MLAGIDEDAVDFRPTYDGEESEPIVLPGAFPNLLANGAAGIAVGMATSIPPHNAGEICAAAIHLIQHPQATTADLLRHMPGPDFPTGGVLVEDASAILTAYETGRGGFRLRAKWEVEKGKHGTWSIVVTEIPYQVQKSRLIEQVAQLMEDKKLPLLGDIRDESSDTIRLVLEPKTRGAEPEVLMETVFRATALETRFPLNMNVLDATRTPRVMPLQEVLRGWLDHRHEVLVRRSNHRLAAIERRLEILDGYLLVYLNLDEVIRIIREEEQPKPRLIERFSLTDVQAEAILNMRLRSLRKLEEMEIRKEHKSLSKELKDLRTLLTSDKAALGADHRGTRGHPQEVRLRPAGRPAHRTGRGARGGRCQHRCLRGARGDHRHPVGKGLDQGDQGRGGRAGRAEIQGRRQAAAAVALSDHRPADVARHQRQGLHAEGRRPAARPWRRPAGAPAGGTDERGRSRRPVRRGRGDEISDRLQHRPRLHRPGHRAVGGKANRQAGAEPEAERGGGAVCASRR